MNLLGEPIINFFLGSLEVWKRGDSKLDKEDWILLPRGIWGPEAINTDGGCLGVRGGVGKASFKVLRLGKSYITLLVGRE
jgi:hypothetical protein